MVTRGRAAVAGALAAAASLAVARVGGALVEGAVDPVLAVGRQVIDLAPAALREPVVGSVGTADKPLLVGGVVAVALALGAGIGIVHRRSRLRAAVAVAALWAVAALASVAVPGATGLAALLLAVGAGLVGLVCLDLLLPTAESAIEGAAGPDRRAFLARAGGVVVLAVGAVLGSDALRARPVPGVRVALPQPVRPAPRPGASAAVPGRTPLTTSSAALYRVDTALHTPVVDAATWRLTLSGLVDRPLSFTYDELMAIPQVEAWITLGCVGNEVGGDLVGTPLWQGVLLADLLRAAGVRPEATQLVGRSVDGYTGAFPAPLALDGRDALVALGMNGEVLTAEHGYPARLVVPGLYGYESAVKWVTDVQLADDSYQAYWVRRGYARYAEFRTQSRIDLPRSGSTVTAGRVQVAGLAWAPHRGVRAVEVQVDGGPWRPADLEPDLLGPDAWRPWSVELDVEPGAHRLAVRATDGAGRVQEGDRRDVLPDGATGHHTVEVKAV